MYRDPPPARAYELAAIHLEEVLAKDGSTLPDGYIKHVFQYAGNEGYAVGSCCLSGALPDTLTGKPDFKEIPWPTINPQ